MCRRIIPGVAAAWWAAAVLGGCSGMGQIATPIASYGGSNAFSPAGYAQTKLDETHFQVRATGTEATPKQRVEKIARARAAQIGVEERLKYFKVASVQHGVRCSKRQAGYKSEASPAASRPTVVLDVVYAKDWADPTFTGTAEAFAALSSELASEVVPPKPRPLLPKRPAQVAGRDDGRLSQAAGWPANPWIFGRIGDEAIKTLRIAAAFV